MSFNKLLLIIMIIDIYLNEEKQAPNYVDELKCGKDKPKKEKDCQIMELEAECQVAIDENDKDGKCYLISESATDNAGIDGKKSFTTSQKYLSCGNKSFYLNYNDFTYFTSIIGKYI